MADPTATLAPRFADALRAAFGDEYASADPALRRSDHADYQADVSMRLAKKLGRSPRDVAQALLGHLRLDDLCTKIEIAGPGFLNLHLRDAFLAREVRAVLADPRLGVPTTARPDTVIIDYSAPNVAKEMHVGHLRGTILGDALRRVLGFLGHRVVAQNHLGDWGTPFGMLIEHLVDTGEADNERLAIADLDGFYVQARAKFNEDPAFADRSRQRVVLLQAGDARTLVLWRRLVDESKRYFALAYERLGVLLRDADVCGESHFNPVLGEVVDDLRAKGLLVESDGALCVFPEGFKGKDDEPLPLIVRKGDGGYGYATTDLAAIRYRVATLGGTRLLYVVGAPQQQHLAMVFAVGRAAGWVPPEVRVEHVAFGSILGADRKMFRTRSGDTVKLIGLLDEAIARGAAAVQEKNPELDAAERAVVARQVGIGAVKYADLSTDRIKDYVFDFDRMLAFEGNTAPYLQYAHARIKSIFRKAGTPGPDAIEALAARAEAGLAPEERRLVLQALAFGATVEAVGATLQPHRLCAHLFDVASAFASFYDHCPILRADDEPTRRARLALADLAARTLAEGLGLLGLEAPEQM